MRPRPLRKVTADLIPLLAEKGVALEQSNHGKGSHRTLIFIDLASGLREPIVIGGSKDISQVVQRGILSYLARRVAGFAVGHPARDHAERVRKILERYFNS
jgi:hypothetical protein